MSKKNMDLLKLVEANKQLKLADYLLTNTYNFSEDPKLLIGILSSLKKYYTLIMELLLEEQINDFEKSLKKLEVQKTILNTTDLNQINTIFKIIKRHEESSVEFVRKKQLVLCDEDYSLEVLSLAQLKQFLSRAKKIHKKIILFVRSVKND